MAKKLLITETQITSKPDNELPHMKIKGNLKQALFDQYWTCYSLTSTSVCRLCIIFTFCHESLLIWHLAFCFISVDIHY